MKKQIILVGFSTLLIAALFIAAGTQDDKKQNKGNQQKEKKQDKQEKVDKGRDDKMQDRDKQQKDKEWKEDRNKGKGIDNKDDKDAYKDDRDRNKVDKDRGKDQDRDNNAHDNKLERDKVMKDGYKWNRKTFRERGKYRNSEKVTLCHKFKREDEPAVTIRVSSSSLNAHLDHGDIRGECPALSEKQYSDGFLRKRTDYYNTVEDNYEQVSYSRSILDYATERLTGARQQLSLMQRNNLPVADIQRKQATVIELEQNVSLLQTLVGVAANLIANKMQ